MHLVSKAAVQHTITDSHNHFWWCTQLTLWLATWRPTQEGLQSFMVVDQSDYVHPRCTTHRQNMAVILYMLLVLQAANHLCMLTSNAGVAAPARCGSNVLLHSGQGGGLHIACQLSRQVLTWFRLLTPDAYWNIRQAGSLHPVLFVAVGLLGTCLQCYQLAETVQPLSVCLLAADNMAMLTAAYKESSIGHLAP